MMAIDALRRSSVEPMKFLELGGYNILKSVPQAGVKKYPRQRMAAQVCDDLALLFHQLRGAFCSRKWS